MLLATRLLNTLQPWRLREPEAGHASATLAQHGDNCCWYCRRHADYAGDGLLLRLDAGCRHRLMALSGSAPALMRHCWLVILALYRCRLFGRQFRETEYATRCYATLLTGTVSVDFLLYAGYVIKAAGYFTGLFILHTPTPPRSSLR